MASTWSLCAHKILQTAVVSEIEIKMALLKYFAPLKTFNMHVCIRKHIACLRVWLHLPVLSSIMKMWNVWSDQSVKIFTLKNFPLYGICIKSRMYPLCLEHCRDTSTRTQLGHKYCGCLCGGCTCDVSFLRFNWCVQQNVVSKNCDWTGTGWASKLRAQLGHTPVVM